MNAPMNAPYSDQPTQGGGLGAFELRELDLVAVWRILRRRIGLIVGTIGVVTALMIIAVFQMTPLYSATAIVMIDPQQNKVVDIEAVLSGLSPDSATVDSEVELLRSRSIAERVVKKLDLIKDPEFNGRLRDSSLIDYINPIKWLKSLAPSDPVVLTDAERDQLLLSEVVEALRSRLSVNRKGLTFVIEISVESERAAKAATIANEMADTYVLDQLEAKFEATRRANVWLNERLGGLRDTLRDSEQVVEVYKSENDLFDTDGVTLNDQQMSELNAQLILTRADKAEKQAKYARVSQLLASGASLDSVSDVLGSPVIAALRQQQSELVRKQAELSSRYGARHPQIINMQAERRDLERQIQAEVSRIAGSLKNDVAVTEGREQSLSESLNMLRARASENNQSLIRLRELQREAEANRTLYQSFLSRFKETAEQQGIQTSDARVISRATSPLDPSFPKKSLIVGITIVFSMLLGVGLAFTVDRLDNTIHTAIEMEQLLGIPHISSIPRVANEPGGGGTGVIDPHDYVLAKPLSAYAEAFRTLRTALALSNVDNPPKVIMFTSSLPNEGKSTTSVSFARAAAQAGAKVVLIDGDLRHPSVHKLLGIEQPQAGLVEYLAGRASFEEASVIDEKSGVRVLPIASGVANPPDLLGSAQMRKLIKQLKDDNDLVIVDAAPVLPVVDSRVLARVVDKTVFVVRWNETPRDASVNAIKELHAYKADIAGCVFNSVDMEKRVHYGYGDAGAYYGQYRKYYVE